MKASFSLILRAMAVTMLFTGAGCVELVKINQESAPASLPAAPVTSAETDSAVPDQSVPATVDADSGTIGSAANTDVTSGNVNSGATTDAQVPEVVPATPQTTPAATVDAN
jgi:hypothetical protein